MKYTKDCLFYYKKATPEGAARNIESIWEERYSIVQSLGGGKPCDQMLITLCCTAASANAAMQLCTGCIYMQMHIICAKINALD